MDAAVFRARVAAHGDHHRATLEVDVEFLGKRTPHRVALDLFDEPGKGTAEFQRLGGVAPALGNRREIGVEAGQGAGRNKARHDQVVEGLPHERGRSEFREVEDAGGDDGQGAALHCSKAM